MQVSQRRNTHRQKMNTTPQDIVQNEPPTFSVISETPYRAFSQGYGFNIPEKKGFFNANPSNTLYHS